MTDEPTNFSDILNAFQGNLEHSLPSNEYGYSWEFKSPAISEELTFTVNEKFLRQHWIPIGHPLKFTHNGKYWFDKKFEFVGYYKSVEIEGNSINAELVSNEWKDLTDYRPLARFLRWVLRR